MAGLTDMVAEVREQQESVIAAAVEIKAARDEVRGAVNRTGFLGDFIAWEDGVYGTFKSIFSGGARACRSDGRGAPGGPRISVGGAAVGGTERQIKVARDTAVKARSAAIITLKTLIVNAPSALREDLDPLTDRKLIDRCHRLKPGEVVDTIASTKHALRAIAARWIALTDEIDAHDVALDAITLAAAPTLRQAFGIGPDSAAEMMIVAGDNPTRIRSESAFAKLCGVCPIPASSGVTNRHRLFRGGHRQANAALYRIVIVRMRWHQPTIDYVARRTLQGLSKKDILRCLKRFVAREAYNGLIKDHRSRTVVEDAA